MDNNYIFYKLRKIFQWDEEKTGQLFKSVEYIVSPLDIFAWMKQEKYEGFQVMPDEALAALMNGFIAEKRGLKDGIIPVPETKLNNNLILRKLKIALSFKDDDIIETLKKADIRIGKAELNAFFRDPKHAHYRICGDQFLRNFLRGLQLKSLKTQ
ncbi:DUF1456 family protein [Fluviicola sp.]|jgi:uncharacterized protein YehS (DUF1456 family)|uniref:DUF1456 family protein n=1 Tax=Fluviicola sp. TaxID=1917219 RepID=UPI00282300F1|nr:DUF1456 family protein [Fluviicola sp.]MDR0802753.1 DUF1456 family protein [Fluviicola sp.]